MREEWGGCLRSVNSDGRIVNVADELNRLAMESEKKEQKENESGKNNMSEDPPAEMPPINWIDVTPEEYERMMKSYCFPLERVHITKEEAEKWFPKDGVKTPAWDNFKEGVEKYIEELKKNGM